MGVFVIKHVSDSSVFLIGLTVVSITMLVVGYLVMNKFDTKNRRAVEVAMIAQQGKYAVQRDTNPRWLKTHIIEILTNNTIDLTGLSNVMDHVSYRIDQDLQKDGLLYGLLVERSIGSINSRVYAAKLGEYIKNLANSLSISLMNMGGDRASLRSRDHINGVRGRLRSTVAFPAAAVNSRGRKRFVNSPDLQIEYADSVLRRR